MYCGFCICPGRQKPKTQSCLQGSMKLLPVEITFGDMCTFLWVCMREKRESGTTQVFWGRQTIGFLDSQRSSRVKNHLSGPLTSQATSFPLWIPEALDCTEGPQMSFILFTNTPQQIQSWKASLTPPFTTCVPSGRTLLSALQFLHTSHKLIRVTVVWHCCRLNQLSPESAWNSVWI